MPTRYLKESICTSENLIALSAEAERFFYRLIVNVDDFGRLDARPQVLRAKCFTMMEDRIAFSDVDAWLEELRGARLLTRYVVNGKPYLMLNTFTEHNKPRADKSKCPDPPADTDTGTPMPEIADNCTQVQADASKCLPIPSYSYTKAESNPQSNNEEDAQAPARKVIQAAYNAAGIMLTKTHQDAHLETIARLSLAAWTTGWQTAAENGKQNIVMFVTRCAESAHLAATTPKKETPTYASNRNNGKNGYGLRRQPGDAAAREPTEDERREWAEWRAAHPESA